MRQRFIVGMAASIAIGAVCLAIAIALILLGDAG